jgi:autophagy-related protein 5
LLNKLHAFFSSSFIEPDCVPYEGWFSFEGVPLKWHYPVGLLYDLYAGADPASKASGGENPIHSISVPRKEGETQVLGQVNADTPLAWRLTVHFRDWPAEDLVRLDADGLVMHDAFINSVKEADFLRNGTAKGIMSLSKEDSSGLWKAIQDRKWIVISLFLSLLPTVVYHALLRFPQYSRILGDFCFNRIVGPSLCEGSGPI